MRPVDISDPDGIQCLCVDKGDSIEVIANGLSRSDARLFMIARNSWDRLADLLCITEDMMELNDKVVRTNSSREGMVQRVLVIKRLKKAVEYLDRIPAVEFMDDDSSPPAERNSE